jgi:predicted RNase H-like HicB family nuclease
VENQNRDTTDIPVGDGGVVADPSSFSDALLPTDANALSDETIVATSAQDDFGSSHANHGRGRWSRAFVFTNVAIMLILFGATIAILYRTNHKNSTAKVTSSVGADYSTQQIPLGGFIASTQGLNFGTSNVVINGALKVNNSLVISPSVQPSAPTAGQMYFDRNTNQLAFYNGTAFVPLTGSSSVVQSINGVSGNLILGGGLTVTGNQINVDFPPITYPAFPTHVSTIEGASGAISVGSGLRMTGNTLQNAGVVGISAGNGISLTDDGNGNFTIDNTAVAGNVVDTTGGTAGSVALFSGSQTIEDSLITQAASTITVTGDLYVTGNLTLGNPLTVSQGGTGTNSLANNGVVVAGGTAPLTSVTASSAGLCFVSTAGAPVFAACPSSTGVSSLNGLSGALTVANASATGSTITLDDASTSAKGIASFNSTNFTATSGVINTVQNISSTATPTFSGVNTNNITPSGSLTIGTVSQSFTVQGTAASVFTVTGNSHTTTLGFTGAASGDVTYNLDRAVSAGAYGICTTAGNCVGVGGGVTSPGGSTNRLSKFNGAQSLIDSSVSDDGTNVTVNGTANLVVQGGTATLGTLTQAGSLVLSDGNSHTAALVISGLTSNRTYTIPDAGSNAAFCLSSGNCVGGGSGSAPNAAEYLVANLNGTLTNERALAAGSNVSITDGGANSTMTVATVQNPTFSTSVTTPLLQSSGALSITSAAGQTVAIDAGTTIELQDDTNVTGNFDVSGSFRAGTGNAFQISAAGAITAATGLTTSGTVTFSGLNCTGNANGGALTTNGSGQVICSDDDGGSGSAISGSGTSGTVALFNGTQTIGNSIITQSGSTITIAGDLNMSSALTVVNGGTGTGSFTTRGLLYGNGTGALGVTAAGTGGQVLVADAAGVPTFMSLSGDMSVSNTGVVAIQPNAVALGTDSTGNYVANLGSLTGLSTTGNTGEGSTPTLSVNYGSIANTAVQGNVTVTCAAGTGNLSGGGGTLTLGAGGSCGNIVITDSPTFATNVTTPSFVLTGAGSNGSVQVGNLGQSTVYTLPDPGAAAATICLSTGNCATAGSAGGDLTGSYPNPTIAKLQGTNLTISGPTAGQILVYNGTNSRWENHAVSGDIAISESGAATVQPNAVALGTDTTGNYVLAVSAGTGTSISGSAGEGWTPSVSVLYGSSAGTAVEGNQTISVAAGTNLTGGGSITLGAGGAVTLNIASSPVFSGTLAVQGATATVGTSSQQGSVVLNDGSSNTGTVSTAALGQNTVYTLPDPGSGTATICLSTGNCAGSGSGVTTVGGSVNRLSKFDGTQSIADSSISDDGSTVTINGSVNLVVQGGTSTLGTTSQAGTLKISDGSSNTVSIIASALSANRTYTLPDAGGDATLCVDSGNCIGGTGGAPNAANYLVSSLDATLTNERALAAGTNLTLTDGGANGNMTVGIINNPSFGTSVTTPTLQSSGALTITSAAGQTVAIDAGTTIELQDSANITGNLDVSGSFTTGNANAFTINSAGAITAATGVTSSGTITFSGLNCTGNANGGALTTNGSGQLICSDDDGGSGSAISGSGTSGTITMFNGTQTITNSIVTQSGTTITIAGDLVLNTALSVANGGTGAAAFASNGVLYGNGTGALGVTAAGTSGQVLVAGAGGVPSFVSFSGDVAVTNTGATTIQANSVALGTDTTGDYVANLGTLTGLSTSGNTGEGSTPTLGVNYGAIANTAVQGNVSLTCASGTGNLSGGGNSITLGSGGSCNNVTTVNNPTFSTSITTPSLILTGAGSNGTIQVGSLGQGTIYTLPDPGGAAATICISTGNCASAGSAGGDLTGTYPNPTIAKLQGTNLTISGPTAGQILVYNGTNSRWENHAVSGDIAISEAGVTTVQANAVALTTDTTGNYVLGVSAGTGVNVTGSAGEGWTPTIAVVYGSSAGTAVEGNTSISVAAGTNLTGGGSITLGSGGTVTVNVASSPTFSGTLTVQGATATVGTSSQQGSVVLHDGAGKTGTVTVAALGQNTTFTLPDPGSSTTTICLSSGNCAGSGSGVTTAGGTTNRLSKFTAAQAVGDSSVSDNGTTVTINGSVNLVVQGGTSTIGTTTQAGTLTISDGSSNTISIVAGASAADRSYTLPDVGGNATFCLSTGNCIGGGGGGAPSDATYLVTSLNGSLSDERSLTAGSNVGFTDGGANGAFTIATVQNPTFTTSVTTPALQSSGALTITSAAGQTVAIDAGTTIELQDSTNITGSLDVSAGFKSGTSDAFQISTAGAITAATGVTSSGTITFSGLNCTVNTNGGALTTDVNGMLICSDDDGGSGSAISGSGTSGKIALFNGAQTLTNSIITQSGSTISIAGDLTLTTALTVANGGTGANTFATNGVLYGNGTSALGVTSAGTSGQVLVAGAGGTPAFVSFSGDVTVTNTGAATIQANSVALGTDTTGNYVDALGTLTGLTTSGNTGEGSTPTLSVSYGAIANTAVQGNVSLTCPSGAGNLTGGGTSITLGTGGTCGAISTVNNPTFSTSVTTPSLILTGAGSNGTLQIANLGQSTAYTLPDPGGAAATICISTGNCATAGSAGGDLTGTYPNPTIAKLQNTNLNISSPAAGHVLVYNGTNSRWENHAISSDVVISETGAATIQANAVALGTDTTGNYVGTLGTLTGLTTSGNTGEGSTPTISVTYGSGANTAVEGNTSLTVTAGTNLSGGGSTTLGAGGTVTLNVASSPVFSGTLAVQGATVTVGANSQQGSVVLSDGAASSKTATVKTNGTLGQNTTFNLPDPGSSSATICLSTGNCAGSGSGVTTVGGTTDRLSKFTGAQAIGDSSISDNGTAVTINGSVNLVVQGGTSTLGTTSQSGTLAISDGSSNTISIVATGVAADRTYTLPDAGGAATFCLSSGNCIGGGSGSAPSNAAYLVATLDGNLSSERALAAGTNISINDGGANGNMTVATVANPTFSTSVTTPTLQSSGALTISSGATTVAIDATTTIELQDSTNVTGNIDISGTFTSGTSNAFTISSAGAITAATGVTSSGTITFSGLNCTGNANGGALTTNGSGVLSCSDDDNTSASSITGTGTANKIALFSGAQVIGNSIITQSGTTISIAGDLTLTTDLAVSEGGTGASTFTTNGVIFGNGTSALGVTAAGTSGQVLVAGAAGVPAFVSFSGDVAVTNTGATTIQADSVALGTDTTGNYVATLGTLTGLTTSGNTGEGSTPTISVTYGSGVNTAAQGNTTLTCPSGTGNLTGGGTSITLGTGGTCGAINTVASPTFTGTLTVQGASTTIGGNSVAGNLILSDGAATSKTGTVKTATLGQNTTYTIPDPGGASASFCLSTGNCTAIGTAGGDLTGSYPNPTIAKLQGSNLNISSPAAGHVLVYNNTNSRWENHAVTGDIAISETGVATVQADSVALGTDTTGNYVSGLTAGNGISISGSAGEGWSPTVTVVYGSSTNTAVQGNTSITVTAGTNLSGGGSITLGSGGTVTLNVASSPTFSGTVTVQGASTTIGGNSVAGNLILSDGAATSKTATIKTTGSLGQNTTYNLPDPAGASATFCLQTSTSCGFAATTGGTGYIQNQSAGAQSSSNFWISGTGRADTSLITPIIQGVTSLTANTAVTNSASTPSGDISILTGNANGTTSASGNIAINNGTATSTAGTISIGTANTSAVNLGRTGITTTNNGALTVTQALSANGGLTVAANQNIAMTSGTGTFTQGFSATTGTASTLNITDSASSGATTVIGQSINITGTNNAGGTNAISGINFANVVAATNNSYYGINVGTGLTDILRYNGTQLISGAGKLQNAGIDSTVSYTNIQKVGGLTSGTINTGFGSITTTAAIQGGTGVFTNANALTLGTASSVIGAIVFNGSGNANTITLAGPASPVAGNFTLSMPAITAAATLCSTNSVCTGYAPTTGGTGYIQNQSAGAQSSSSFWISSTGRIDGGLTTNNVTSSSGALTLQAATNVISLGGSDTLNANGGFTIQSGSNSDLTVNANGTGTLSLGSNATSSRIINVGATGSQANTSTVNIGTSTGAAQTVSIGSTNGASATTISAGTGNMLLQTNSASASINVKSATNSSTAFQIQNASTNSMFGVDTVSNVISVNTGVGGVLTSWSTMSSTLNTGASFGGQAVANGYIYSIGGYSNAYQTTVQYAPLKTNGTIGTWATTTVLPAARGFIMSSVATYGNYMYVVGGSADGTNGVSTVYYAKMHQDGTVGAWTAANALPANRLGAAVVVFNGRIYAMGGGTTSSGPTTTIYYAEINSDGGLTPWTTDGTVMPVTYSNASAIMANGKVYYMGGTNSGGTSQTGVYYATIDPLTGDVGSWTTNGTSLPTATSSASAINYNGYVYIMNGGVATYYYAPITSAGAIGTWSSQISMTPMTTRTGTATAEYNGYFYAMGGFTGGAGQTAIYSASAARTKVSGALDLVGATDGVVAGDGSAGGSLTAGDTSVVGTLNVQGQANFSQNLSVAGNITLGSESDLNKYSTITVKSAGYSGMSLISDTTNNAAEPGGAFIDFSVDGGTTAGTIGISQNVGTSPDALTTVTNGLVNAFMVGNMIGSGATQIISGDGSGNGVARITVVNGATTRVCIAMTTCSNSTLGVTGTIKATSTITASTTPDIAETIAAAPDVEAADVVMADPHNTERVVKSSGAYQGAALGVISDGSSSFMINAYANDAEAPLNGAPLVLAGRVPVKVTAEGGEIKPGDYLTTSSTPGKAMKATHAGPTIGKALGFYDGVHGDGTVLVFVNASYYDPASSLQGPVDGSYANLNASGNTTLNNLTVTGLTTLGEVRINGKIMTGGAAPQVTGQAAGGAGAQVTVTGNDTAGRIEIITGSSPIDDDLLKLVFNSAFTGGSTPEVVISPVGKGSASILPYVDGIDPTGFVLGAGAQPLANTKYVFTYHVLGVAN